MKIKKQIINNLSYCLEHLISNLSKFQIFIEREFLKENKFGYEDLTPNIKETEIKKNQTTYIESIKWAILNENIKNVALTGFYGTGKSTILNSFIKKNKGLKYLMISLSKFNDSEYDEQDIEVAILQQIFYSKKQDVLPDSRLKRIKNNKYLFPKAVIFFLWIISIIYILFPNLIHTVIVRNNSLSDFINKSIPYKNIIEIPLIVLFIVGLFILIKNILKEILNLKLNKLSVNDLELIPKEDKDNLLNKNIDEIIYFFEKTNVEVVIIEDLDRFNSPSILTKLREINSLINNCEDINNKVTFIYAIKDDMFTQNNNRAKFFDFIIPLIPIINYDNSYEILSAKLSAYDNINDDFLKNISPYTNDMRTLKNIVNEFKVYHNILKVVKKEEFSTSNYERTTAKLQLPYFNYIKIEQNLPNAIINNSDNTEDIFDNQKLLSLIIYKNYYPKDFTDLQLQKGKLYSILNKKEELYKNIIIQEEKKIDEIEAEIKKINAEKITEIITLRKLYLYELIKEIINKVNSNVVTILGEGIKLDDDSLLKDQNFSNLLKSENIEYSNYNHRWDLYKSGSNISFKNIETQVDKNMNYSDREDIIKDKLLNKISSLELKRKKIQDKIKGFKYSDFSDSILHTDSVQIKKYIDGIIDQNTTEKKVVGILNEEKNHDYNLLKTLLMEGYIDEHYIDYISHFYKGSLTVNDNDLKKKIIEQKTLSFDNKIDNVQRLVEKLAESNFKKPSILNYEILEYLIDGDNYEKTDIIIETISKEDFLTYEFIKGYLINLKSNVEKKEKIIPFIDIMLDRNSIFWKLLCDNNLDKDIKDEVLVIMLLIGNPENLNKQNSNNILLDYINNLDDFLEIFNNRFIYEDELIKSLKLLDIKFSGLNFNNNMKSLFEKIYKNNLYVINSKMIFELLIFKKNNYPENTTEYTEEEIYNSNYTTIIKSNFPELKNYIDENMKDYLKNVFLKLDSNNEEDEDTVINLLKYPNDIIDISLKSEIIKKQNNKISNIKDVNNDLWDELLKSNKLQPNWKNIFIYFKKNKNFDTLEDYLNIEENYIELSKTIIGKDLDEDEDETALINDFIKKLINSNISTISFTSLTKSIDEPFDNIATLEVINLEKIAILIESKKINLTNENVQYLLNNDLNDRKLYVTIIEVNETLFNDIIDEFIFSDEMIVNLIVKGTLSEETIANLIKNFESQITLLAPSNLSKIADYLSDIKLIDYSHELYMNLITHSNTIEIKINFLTNNFISLDERTVFDSLNLLGDPFSKIEMKESFEIITSPKNLKLLDLLKGKYIKTIYKKKNGYVSVAYK